MQLNKEYLIIAGFIVLFLLYYLFGWFCDKNFRLVMRKTKLSPFKKFFLHFRGAKTKENKGHAVVCVKFEEFSFLNLFLGAFCFAAVKLTEQDMVFYGSAALMAMSFAGFAFQVYTNTGIYNDRKKQAEMMDETGFEDYRAVASPIQPEAQDKAYPNVKKSVMADSDDRIDSLESGKEYLKRKGLLDDDTYSPYFSDSAYAFRDNRNYGEFSDESNIQKGKEALKDFAGKQLNTEAYRNVNNFESPVNSYSSAPSVKEAENKSAQTADGTVNEHKNR